MNQGRTVFSQVMDFLLMYEFRKCVSRYNGNHRVRSFSCLDQFLSTAFAQLTYLESLRDIEAGLGSLSRKLYQMGFRGRVIRKTPADANENRDWRIYADFALVLIHSARELYYDDWFGVELASDSLRSGFDNDRFVPLTVSMGTISHYRGAVKLRTLLDLRANISAYIRITTGKVREVNILDDLIPEPRAWYIMDRGYLDFACLYRLTGWSAFFVTRAKVNLQFRWLYSHPVDKLAGLLSDQTIVLTAVKTATDYADKLRRTRYRDPETGKIFTFLSNNFNVPAETIARVYKSR